MNHISESRFGSFLAIWLTTVLLASCNMPGAEPDDISLSALQVTGGGMLFPSFSPGVRHYGVRCADGTTLQVTAQARDAEHSLKLLHSDLTGTGSVADSVTVNSDHDIAIEVSDGKGTSTYYVHCIPPEFPDIRIEKRTDAVTDGLLLMAPHVLDPTRIRAGRSPSLISFLAIVDNSGVPRWVRKSEFGARDFRRHADGRYSHAEWDSGGRERVVILDTEFNRVAVATTVGDVTRTIGHEFLVTEQGNYLLLSYHRASRDLSDFVCTNQDGSTRDCSETEPTQDSVIQEVTPEGVEVFRWNSWDHMKISDCGIYFDLPMNYAVINSMYLLDGDIVASFRGCNQILLIDRPSGDVVWQMGGTKPTRSRETQYLEVVGDPAGEFCGQHSAKATSAGAVLIFDNGFKCRGPRKLLDPFTRVVEYDVSSGTEARFVREYRLPEAYGYAALAGAVVALADNGHWLITWGRGPPLSVSEVDTGGNEIFRLRMSDSTPASQEFWTYRVYREREADLNLRPNLP